jgi:hypothetical protein
MTPGVCPWRPRAVSASTTSHPPRREDTVKKIKLSLEELQIDSFATTEVPREKGTVFGEQCTCHTACTCPGCPTCDASCNGTCGDSCYGSCGDSCYLSCGGTCGASCEASCDGGYSCAYTCEGFATFGGPNMDCRLC